MKTDSSKSFNKIMVIGVAVIVILAVIIIVAGKQGDRATSFGGFSSGQETMFYGDADMAMDSYSGNLSLSRRGTSKVSIIDPSPLPPNQGGLTAAESDDPKVIKTAQLNLDVDGVAEKTNDIANLATSVNGFVESSTVAEDEAGYKTGYITVRVPVDSFDATVSAIKDLAVRVERESINGQDVTEQYTDLEARLRSAQAQEEQYLTILQQAQNVTEILAVQQYLQNIRYEIESLQGQIDSLGNQTDYSTISVTLSEETKLQVPAEKFDLGRDIKLALQTVVLLAQAALTFIVYFLIVGAAIVIPAGLIIALVVWLIKKIVRRLS